MKFYSFRMRLMVFLITLAVVGAFFVLGVLFDYFFKTHPLGVVIAVVISFPVNAYALRKYFKHYFSKNPQIQK